MPQPAVVEDLEERRAARAAALTAGKCLDLVAARMPRTLAMEVRQAAGRADTSVSDWLMQAAIEKIVADEIKLAAGEALAQAKKTRKHQISDAMFAHVVRTATKQLATGKKRE